MNTPCVALFGPSDDARWAPWQVKHRVLKDGISCRPCNLDGCGNGKVSDCLMKIGPDAVVEATESLLSQSD
jgi:heptosyltransferase-3